MNKVLFAIFGGVCSGKTTLAKALEKHYGCRIVSKDVAIYEADRKARETDTAIDFEDILKSYNRAQAGNVILDKTIRAGDLATFVDNGFEIVGIQLVVDTQVREARLKNRVAQQSAIVSALEDVLRIKLERKSREERQELWKDHTFWMSFDQKTRAQAELLLEKIYGTGSHILKPEYPNVVNFPEVSYVCELDTSKSSSVWDFEEIFSNLKPWGKFRARKMAEIEHAIFDVGGVVYDFSKSSLLEVIENAGGDSSVTLEFDDYMRGFVDFQSFCQSISDRTGARMTDRFVRDVYEGLRRGRQHPRKKVVEAMERLTENGVKVSVFSNAIPALQVGEPYYDLVPPERRFFSFDFGLLKPDHKSYRYVLDRLNANPTRALFIDDKLENVVAAREVGMHSFVFIDPEFEATLAPYCPK
jgi:HAD superfamily hydrolase (TIGR01509 family)